MVTSGELPPRTRRIHDDNDLVTEIQGTTSAHAENTGSRRGAQSHLGTTSAHAENTHALVSKQANIWNYLRARGEYIQPCCACCCRAELPPRTRRIQHQRARLYGYGGTTSAHAENTHKQHIGLGNLRNYLRARGEYCIRPDPVGSLGELPPRTRRIPGITLRYGLLLGTTSAHAENTGLLLVLMLWPRNYLRARGEYSIYF